MELEFGAASGSPQKFAVSSQAGFLAWRWQLVADRFPFPGCRVGQRSVLSSLTVAGPRRLYTGFPFQAFRPPENSSLYHKETWRPSQPFMTYGCLSSANFALAGTVARCTFTAPSMLSPSHPKKNRKTVHRTICISRAATRNLQIRVTGNPAGTSSQWSTRGLRLRMNRERAARSGFGMGLLFLPRASASASSSRSFSASVRIAVRKCPSASPS